MTGAGIDTVKSVDFEFLNAKVSLNNMWYFSIEEDPEIFIIERDLDAMMVGTMHNQVQTDPQYLHKRVTVICYLNR